MIFYEEKSVVFPLLCYIFIHINDNTGLFDKYSRMMIYLYQLMVKSILIVIFFINFFYKYIMVFYLIFNMYFYIII